MAFYQLLRLVTIIYLINNVLSENKYSRTANEQEKSEIDFRTLEKPFRMNKLNLVWVKAQQRLTEPKLKSLYSDLMIQDKAEIIYKRVKSEGGDKEGLREADLRRKLSTIMTNYGLREHFEDTSKGKQKQDQAFNEAMDSYINKSLFKDKKLNMLWAKAEASGFTSEELAALREEFMHHQDKIDQYYDLLVNMEAGEKDGYKNTVNEEELVKFNEIHQDETDVDKDFLSSANLVREKHRDLRDGYDRLQRISARGPANKEFIEPKVQGLWKMAAASNFTVDELESLKVELKHYESRLLKLRMLHADHLSAAGDKMDYFADQQQMIKKHTRKVEKLHADLEGRIMARHTEL
ncbi:alpha-2-macroglobulin receptor-associated protein isoform X2 [Bicyclus anynana]|uniref:Alpha-2-macroglobulin receptor-associated protein isoform X2 n=1 Tax=Bicyclus anynana TaxID=110368 RepID=A0A6J1NHB1_BICAN|nr:alpha-2-macroglobulin receptor-associated protein isoform X2 [Bicyclus anynana]